MTGPAIPFLDYASGPEPLDITPGDGGFAVLTPISEPLSVGEPPVAPDLCSSVRRGDVALYLPDRAGYTKARQARTVGRLTGRATWTNVTYVEREQLRSWFRDTIKDGLYACDLRIDGPDAEPITVKPVRGLIADEQSSNVGRKVYTVSMEWEEVFSQTASIPGGFAGPLFDDEDNSFWFALL